MAWIDVKKAYYSVDHKWLEKLMSVHRFPKWVGKVVRGLSSSWNTRIVATPIISIIIIIIIISQSVVITKN